jgi:hypothetical protein
MARYTGPVCRLCRREGMKLYLKGARCDSPKCPIVKRQPAKNFPPGQHGQRRTRRPSEFGLQLREKQKVRRFYGIMESQFHKHFVEAVRRGGVTGDNLLQILETTWSTAWGSPTPGVRRASLFGTDISWSMIGRPIFLRSSLSRAMSFQSDLEAEAGRISPTIAKCWTRAGLLTGWQSIPERSAAGS